MNVVFCADRQAIPGLHVAAFSLLTRYQGASSVLAIYLLTEDINSTDAALLRKTLARTGKKFELTVRNVDTTEFALFPALNGSRATYYRLVAPQVLPIERFLYIDADTLVDVDVGALSQTNMHGMPAAWVREAPLRRAVDTSVAKQLSNDPNGWYYNAGVMLVDATEWKRQQITERARSYINEYQPRFHDQSALNCVLRHNSIELEAKFNCIANMRKNWPKLRHSWGEMDAIAHFVDYPKPWSAGARWIHPQYRLWRSVYEETELSERETVREPAARSLSLGSTWRAYKKAAKDRLLFTAYSRGWIRRIKGLADSDSDTL